MKNKLYYPELNSTTQQLPAKEHTDDQAAVAFYREAYGDDLIAVINDDGNGVVRALDPVNGQEIR